MRIIIPGGSGLIGKALIPALAAGGNEVWVLTRRPQLVLPGGARSALWDGKTTQGWQHLVDGAGAIINLVGENIGSGLWTAAKKKKILISRLDAGKAIVEAVRSVSHKPKIMLQSSAIGCYGMSEDQTFTENSPIGSDEFAEICAAWEASTQPLENMGVRRVILRNGLFLDLHQGILPKLMLPLRLFVGGPLGNGRQWYSWVHPADYVNAVIWLINNENATGPFNLTAPEPSQMADFGRALAAAMRRPYYFPVPGFALRLVLGQLSTLVLKGQRVVPSRLLESGFKFQFSSLHDALSDILGKKP